MASNPTELMLSFLEKVYPLYLKESRLGIDALNRVFHYLLDDEMTLVHKEDQIQVKKAKEEITGINLDVKFMRKAFQLYILQAFKDDQIVSPEMTPDAIGYFIHYLIQKLFKTMPAVIFDPLIGTGNLMATIAEHDEDLSVVGVDLNDRLLELARNYLDALDIPHQLYHQDTLSFEERQFPLIVTDFQIHRKDLKGPYTPYYVVLHHLNNLEPEGYFIALIENDFFATAAAEKFKELLIQEAHLYGLLKLDESLFKNHPKSILILKKKRFPEEKIDRFLVADIPSFTDSEAMSHTLHRLNTWFEKG